MGFEAFSDQGDERVVRSQLLEDEVVAGGVGFQPEVGFAFGDFQRKVT